MKKKLSLVALLSAGWPMVVFAGGMKGGFISDEALILILAILLTLIIGSISTAIAYHRTYKPVYLIISSILTLPFFLGGVYMITLLDNFPLIPVLCFIPVLINTLLFITAKPKPIDQA